MINIVCDIKNAYFPEKKRFYKRAGIEKAEGR